MSFQNALKELYGKRYDFFEGLVEGKHPREAAGEIGMSRSGVQPYIEGYRAKGWIKESGFEPTATGIQVYHLFEEAREEYENLETQRATEEVRRIWDNHRVPRQDLIGVVHSLLEERNPEEAEKIEEEYL